MNIQPEFLENTLWVGLWIGVIWAGFWPPVAQACTRILWNNNQFAVVVGRTMDWPESTEPILTVFPRGMKRNGGLLGGHARCT